MLLSRVDSGNITGGCQFMRGKMGKVDTRMNILGEESDFLRSTNRKSLSKIKGNEINNYNF